MSTTSTCSPRLRKHILIDSSDCDELSRFWSRRAQPNSLEIFGTQIHVVIAGLEIEDLSVFSTQATGCYRVRTVQLGDSFSLAAITGGTSQFQWEGRKDVTDPLGVGTVALLTPGSESIYSTSDVSAITIKVGLMASTLFRIRAMPHKRRLELCGVLPPEDAYDLSSLMNYFVDEIDRMEFDGNIPPQIKVIKDALVRRSVLYFQKILGSSVTNHPGEVETVTQCDRAIRFSSSPIHSVRDLVHHVHYSERQIYRAFDCICDCTPSDYIRRTHLINARSQIRHAVGGPTPIQIVAHACGYSTLRTFIKDYIHEFDQDPFSSQ